MKNTFIKNLFRFSLVLFSTGFFPSLVHGQKLSNRLLTRTWYCNCDFNSDTLILAENNKQDFSSEIEFALNAKVTTRNLKKNTKITHYNYSIKKKNLEIYYRSNDSLTSLNYNLNSRSLNGVYKLTSLYSLRYKKRKKTDLPPSDHFVLTNGEKKKTFYKLTDILVYSTKKGIDNDSIHYVSRGEFLELRMDTLLLNSYQFSENNLHYDVSDTLHSFIISSYDSLIKIKIPLKEITKIVSQREQFSSIITGVGIAALGTFVVSLPIALSVKSEPTNTIFTRAAVISALSLPEIVALNFLFSKKTYNITAGIKTKNIWQFEKLPDVP